MAVANVINVQALGRRLADAIVGFNAPIAEIWTSEYRGAIQVWIITDKVELDRERLVYHALAEVQDAYPDQYLDFQVFSPMNFPDGYDLRALLPANVSRIEPQTAE